MTETVFIEMSSIVALLQAAEYIERHEKGMRKNWQDLPDELILKILTYSEVKGLLCCGQVSKRIRRISHDGTLWVTASLNNKVVKTELLELILCKGCKILNISNSTIVGHFSSIIKSPIFKSQLKELDLSQSALTGSLPVEAYSTENIDVLEELLFSCSSLQCLKMEGLLITPKMAVSICKNGKTLQVLNLNHVYTFLDDVRLNYTGVLKNDNLEAIINCRQELDLDFVDGNDVWLDNEDRKILAKNVSPNFNLSNHNVNNDNNFIILLIKVLTLKGTLITSDSLETIRHHLNLTLEELSLAYYDFLCFTGIIELTSMSRLRILNLYENKCISSKGEESQNIRQLLPHLMIRTYFDN